MRGPPWDTPPEDRPSPPSPPLAVTDRQGLAGVLARHVLHAYSEVAHGALTAAEVQAMWVHVQQVPMGAEGGGHQRNRWGWETGGWRGGGDGHAVEALRVADAAIRGTRWPIMDICDWQRWGTGGRPGSTDGGNSIAEGGDTKGLWGH